MSSSENSSIMEIPEDIREHTPPPDYTFSDPFGTKKSTQPVAGPSQKDPSQKEPSPHGPLDQYVDKSSPVSNNSQLRQRPIPQNSPTVVTGKVPMSRKQKSGQGGASEFAKGLMPTGIDDGEPFTNEPYSIYTDPLLQDNKESEYTAWVGFLQVTVLGLIYRNRKEIWQVISVVFLVGYTFYLGFAVAHSPYGAIAPLVVTGFAVMLAGIYFVKRQWGHTIQRNVMIPFSEWWDEHWYILKWFVYPAPLVFVVILLSVLMTDIKQLQSLSGFIIFFCLVWLTSVHPNKVVWRPIIWGYSTQFVMALLVLQWDAGYTAVEWFADYVAIIINFAYKGASFVYGDPWMLQHAFVTMGMSLLIYVGALMSILYYLGVTQIVASKLAWAMSKAMGTTAIETLGVSSNIMLNGMDVIIMLRGYLMKMTMSEFNCFMVGNNATIAGFMFGLLILFGAPPQHLITAAVMSAPASIAIAKLNYPETVPEKSITRRMSEIRLAKGPEKNLAEAAANGSALAGRTALTVMVNYISFMSLLEFIDAGLMWAGERVGFYELSFEWICSYLFWPIALLVGVEISQCREIAKVIGLKVFTTEVYAYQVLGDIYDKGLIDDRSKALGTYALCGFCSLSTLAIAVGIWHVLCPPRRPLVSKLMIRVMFEANISCFTTACVAGLFYSQEISIFEAAQRGPLSKLATFLFANRLTLFS